MKRNIFFAIILFWSILSGGVNRAEDGYRLWLRYDKISNQTILKSYQNQIKGWIVEGESKIIESAKEELQNGLNGLFGKEIPNVKNVKTHGILIASTYMN